MHDHYFADADVLNVVTYSFCLTGSVALTGGISWLVLDSGAFICSACAQSCVLSFDPLPDAGNEENSNDLGGSTDLLAQVPHDPQPRSKGWP